MRNPIKHSHKLSLTSACILIPAFLILFVMDRPGSATAGTESTDAAYQKEVNDWHAKRIERLRAEYGWLSLVGLMPVSEGENGFGSAADNDLVFPEKAPEHAGVLTLDQGTVRLEVTAAGKITCDSLPVQSMVLGSDADEETTILDMGDLRFYVIARGGRFFVRIKDREAETLKNFKGIARYPVRSEWRIEARFEPYDPPKKIMIPNALGMEFEESCPGVVVFEVGEVRQRLEPTSTSQGGLFFVFADGTSGDETYGGGRFLYADPPGPDGKVLLDFNKAYNPPCVFTPYATCPLPHAGNILKVKIEAGEKNYGGGAH
jgi:uncharacterized protein (DUF1684 family)